MLVIHTDRSENLGSETLASRVSLRQNGSISHQLRNDFNPNAGGGT